MYGEINIFAIFISTCRKHFDVFILNTQQVTNNLYLSLFFIVALRNHTPHFVPHLEKINQNKTSVILHFACCIAIFCQYFKTSIVQL